MTAREFIRPITDTPVPANAPVVGPDEPVFSIISAMADAAADNVIVAEHGIQLGVITAADLIAAVAPWFRAIDETSLIIVECHPDDYSASLIAHAVEDADAHLLSLLTAPAQDNNQTNMMRVCLRVRLADPERAIHSLERYSFRVADAFSGDDALYTALDERLAALKVFLNV